MKKNEKKGKVNNTKIKNKDKQEDKVTEKKKGEDASVKKIEETDGRMRKVKNDSLEDMETEEEQQYQLALQL